MRERVSERDGVERVEGVAASSPEVVYTARRDGFAARRDRLNAQRFAAANASVFLFFTIVVLAVIAIFSSLWPLFAALALLALIGFVLAFRRQGQLDDEHRRYVTLTDMQVEGLARLRRDWANIPLVETDPGAPRDDEAQSQITADDIDLLGHASLQHLLSGVSTPASRSRLRGWILTPAPPDLIRQRQAAASDLAPRTDARDELSLFGRLSGMTHHEYGRFLSWAESAPWLATRPMLIWVSRILPTLTVLALIAQLAHLTSNPFWLAGIILNVIITSSTGKRIEELLDEVAERQVVFLPYATIFGFVQQQPFEAALLRQVQADLAAERVKADEQMRRLSGFLRFGDSATLAALPDPPSLLPLEHPHALAAGGLAARRRPARAPLARTALRGRSARRAGHARLRESRLGLARDGRRRRTAHPWHRARPSPVAARPLRRQRRHHRPAGHPPTRHRLQHVRQEHPPPRRRRQRHPRADGRTHLRRVAAPAARPRRDQHAHLRLVGVRRLLLPR